MIQIKDLCLQYTVCELEVSDVSVFCEITKFPIENCIQFNKLRCLSSLIGQATIHSCFIL